MKLFPRDALAVLFGRKTAMDNCTPGLIDEAYRAAKAAKTTVNYHLIMESQPDQTTQHTTAVAKIKRVNAYLKTLPGFFTVILAALATAQATASVGSAEREQLKRAKDEAEARSDELEALIGEAADAADAADTSDNAFPTDPTTPTPTDVNTPPTTGTNLTPDPATLPQGQEAGPNPPISAVTGTPTTAFQAVVGSDNPAGTVTPDQVNAATDTSGPPADSSNPTPPTGAGTPDGSATPAETLAPITPGANDNAALNARTVPATAKGTGPAHQH